MNTQQVKDGLREELQVWDELLSKMSHEQLTVPLLSDGQSIKDILGHLHAWQQLSIARLEAARLQSEPDMPAWLHGQDPDKDELTDEYNARIQAVFRDQSWAQVYTAWRDGYRRFLELADMIPDSDLLDETKYSWLKGYNLLAVLEGSCEHHQEHRGELLSRFG